MKALWQRDLRLAWRQPGQWLLPLAFFLAAACLFPLGLGAEPVLLARVAPGVVWVCALLAMMLSVNTLFADDFHDGTLEQLLISRHPLWLLVAQRVGVHWLHTGLPLLLLAPLLGGMLGLEADALAVLALSLLLGSPVLTLLGALGSALTLGLRHGPALVLLLVLPLAVPVLVFAAGAVSATQLDESPQAPLSLLAALFILTSLGAPPLTAAALRLAGES